MNATRWLLAIGAASLLASLLLLAAAVRQGRHVRRMADNVDKVTPGQDE